ncbi:MAG: hypothetical protein L0J17_01895 [Brevibacterium sp.]|uniref:Glycoside hydrolase family 15 n=1 Tax=Brevibacterium aurantiacum TaxID=273384 RepID=A0A2A3YSG3_BREAU|nr:MULTISPECIES: hypothetical protein [Brevibacterium]MDN5587026.1 hypothetical protein [Brevibacterium sp.]MDN5805737.1 hypothetical protein [Brevibacterium sp.]MDN5832798.1 hypothetical protein [Brevibacterium sp.]MDN5875367.1 hypothetical protein [Brevibacterium sp.]MDN5908085.1 hypothetical protein [Brevibacterium sp.]
MEVEFVRAQRRLPDLPFSFCTTVAEPFIAEGAPQQKASSHMTSVPQRRRSFRSRPSRRQVLTGALSGAGLLGAGFVTSSGTDILAEVGRNDHLRSVTVAFISETSRMGIGADAGLRLKPGSRVMPGTDAPGPEIRQQEFLDRCAPWIAHLPEQRRDLATSALLDLWVLTDSLPATVASWSQPWRYIWPRDAAFAAVALARVGLVHVAWQHLLHLQSLQSPDGSFAARFTPDQGSAPDERLSQFDALGLLLWAVSEVHDSGARAQSVIEGSVALEQMAPMLRRSSTRLLHLTERGRTLPPVSPDYWEVSESQVTLGTAGPTLLGLQALVRLAEHSSGLWDHIDGGADALGDSCNAFEATFSRTFIANGLQRYPTSGGLDSAVAYLPAAGAGLDLGESTLDHVWDRLRQPAGGIKPGHGWIFDHTSWTPSTSLMGVGFARIGATAQADGVLDWLGSHRTQAGSLPEKVSAEGAAVSVAPLSWTASNVILTLDELHRARP